MRRSLRWMMVGAVLFCAFAPACRNSGKESAAKAGTHVERLVQLVDKDVQEIERGVPEGAKRLSEAFAKPEAKLEPNQVRTQLRKLRREVIDLNIAKSTFFAVADEKGIAVRNDLEEDSMAGLDLLKFFPELPKAASVGFITTTGAFPNAATKAGPDKDWLAAAPIKKGDGSAAGYFVTGWSYRYFARHLSEVLKADLNESSKREGNDGKIPVFYVGVFDKSGVYSSPLTPSVNEQAMAEADLVAKTANGPFQSVVTITDRTFGYAAARTPKLGDSVGVFVLRSEI